MTPKEQRERAFAAVAGELADQRRRTLGEAAETGRHRFRNAVAAVRLLQGAYLAGDLDRAGYEKALEKMKGLEPVELDVAAHAAELEALRGKGGKARAVPRKDRGLQLLVVDDQADTAGWRVLFDALFPGQVRYALDADSALAQAREHGSRLGLVLLDLRLPDRPKQGLDVLQAIKHEHVDLPVIIFSGLDEIRFARHGFRAGAADYFVKELREQDRDPARYYGKLLQVLSDNVPPAAWRSLWQGIRQLPAPPAGAAGQEVYRSVLYHLRTAYYFLTTSQDDPRIRLMFEDASVELANIYSHCVGACGLAFEKLVEECETMARRRLNAARRGKALAALGVREEKAGFDDKLDLLQKAKLLDGKQVQQARELRKQRNNALHPRKRFGHALAVKVFEDTLALAEPLLQAIAEEPAEPAPAKEK